MRKICAFILLSGLAVAANADVIPDRASLNALLGGGGTTDGFEAFNIGDGNAENLDISVLNEGSIANGQGPGLVNDGATYSASGAMQWNGNNYYSLTTRTILANSELLTISYDSPTTAMGLDMAAFAGFGDTAVVNVYNTAGGLLFSGNIALPNDGSDVFFGYESAGGIGSVQFDGATWSWSPNIDDHSYGVPAPASVALLGLGAMAAGRRRR